MKALSDVNPFGAFLKKRYPKKIYQPALGGQWHQPSGIRQTYSPVAMNRRPPNYICTKNASYLYDHKAHAMIPVNDGDVRPADAPYVSSCNGYAEPWAAMDAEIVSQNISLFCSGTGLLPIRVPA